MNTALRAEEDARTRFLGDVQARTWTDSIGTERTTTAHAMTVLHNDGLYRHLRFQKPDTYSYYFDLITTPGLLTIRGDMGSYVFARLPDMFQFFTGGSFNPHYWAEKLVAHSGVREYSEALFRQYVREDYDDRTEDWSQDDRAWLWNAITDEILSDDEIGYEQGARASLATFRFTSSRPGTRVRFDYSNSDTWEWDLHDHTYQYLWCCHAIRWGIAKYTEATNDEH